MDVRTILERARGLVRPVARENQLSREEFEAKLAEVEAEKDALSFAAQESLTLQAQTSADAFVDGLVRGGSLVPAQREAAVSLLAEAYGHEGLKESGLVQRVKDVLSAAPKHTLFSHQIAAMSGVASAVSPDLSASDAETSERARLLALTDLGKRVLAQGTN